MVHCCLSLVEKGAARLAGRLEALEAAQAAFRQAEGRDSEGWEAAVLDATNGRRAFRRIDFGRIGRQAVEAGQKRAIYLQLRRLLGVMQQWAKLTDFRRIPNLWTKGARSLHF